MVTTRSKSAASPTPKAIKKGTSKISATPSSRKISTATEVVNAKSTPSKASVKSTLKRETKVPTPKSTKKVSSPSSLPMKASKKSPLATGASAASFTNPPVTPKTSVDVVSMSKEGKTSPSVHKTLTDKLQATPQVVVSERKHRKKVVPDTSYERAPKVIPGGAVVCISRLPHGFFENELRAYLSQFGDISRLRLSRSPRTGASRHYAFVEFRHAEVARIVAETMHNYLLAGHLLQCSLMPEEGVHPAIWKGANRKFVHIPWRRMEMKRFNARTMGQDNSRRLITKKSQELASKGIDYDLDSIICEDL